MEKEKKIVSLAELSKVLTLFAKKKSVLIGGCFDILHYGHLVFLGKAKRAGDFLIVLLESDNFILNNKKRKPVHNQQQRAEIIASLWLVDLVVLLPYFRSDTDYYGLVSQIKPKIIAVTRGDPQLDNKKRQAELVKAKVKIVSPLIKKFSTSNILNHRSMV